MNAPTPLIALQAHDVCAGIAPEGAPLPTPEERLRATLDNAAAGLFVHDEHGRIVDANRAAVAMLGLRPDAQAMLRVDPRWRLLAEDGSERPDGEAPWLHTLRTGAPMRDVVLTAELADGSRRWLLVNTNVLPGPGGARGVISSTVDITAERQLELRLAEQSRRLRTLFHLAPIGLALYDLDRDALLEINPELARITGYARHEIVASANSTALPEPLSTRDAWVDAARAGSQFGPLERTIRRRDGRMVDVVLSGTGTDEPGGARIAWLMVQDVSERRAAERSLVTAARLDALTGLANRTALALQLDALVARTRLEPGFGLAVLFLDFDRFKLINDTLGHDAGDELLRSIAARLQRALPPLAGIQGPAPGASADAAAAASDWLVARFGGDEFVILAPGVADTDAAARIAEQLLRALAPAHRIGNMELLSTASIGIAFGSAQTAHGTALLRDADTAMYEAKRRGRRTFAFFDQAMHARLTRTLEVEEALQRAQAQAQLQLHYQPIIDLESGAPTSAEALLRWRHPTLGAVSPAEFVPIAEENGLIIELGRWALFESCAAWARWQRDAPRASPSSLSVNLSRVQLKQGTRLLNLVREALETNGMPAHALQLEVTEREVMQDPDTTLLLIESLRGLGVRIAMDDFGTGASSLACLREYPFDTVKIDKSFVTDLCADPQVMAVAHATVSVIENLGMTSVAEGIESDAEVAALQAIGCRYGQGYLFARPMDEASLLAYFARRVAGG